MRVEASRGWKFSHSPSGRPRRAPRSLSFAPTRPRSPGLMSSSWRSSASTSNRNARCSRGGSSMRTSGLDGVAVRAFPGERWSADWRTNRSAGGPNCCWSPCAATQPATVLPAASWPHHRSGWSAPHPRSPSVPPSLDALFFRQVSTNGAVWMVTTMIGVLGGEHPRADGTDRAREPPAALAYQHRTADRDQAIAEGMDAIAEAPLGTDRERRGHDDEGDDVALGRGPA